MIVDSDILRISDATDMASLFTIICEYKGGTYTKQLHAAHPVEAFSQWAGIFMEEDILKTSERKDFTDGIDYSLAENSLVALEVLQNVWYEAFSIENDLLEVLVIGTSEQPIRAVVQEVEHNKK